MEVAPGSPGKAARKPASPGEAGISNNPHLIINFVILPFYALSAGDSATSLPEVMPQKFICFFMPLGRKWRGI
jgi:hypothetical protein